MQPTIPTISRLHGSKPPRNLPSMTGVQLSEEKNEIGKEEMKNEVHKK